MVNEMSIQENTPQEQNGVILRERIDETCDRVNCEIKNYLLTQKTTVKMAEEGFKKAKTPDEKQYYMGIIVETKNEERQDIYCLVGAGLGLAALYAAYRITRLIVLKRYRKRLQHSRSGLSRYQEDIT